MNARDQQKLAKKGFIILRTQDYSTPHFRIESDINPTSWRKLPNKFTRKQKEIDRYVKRLLTQDDIIED